MVGCRRRSSAGCRIVYGLYTHHVTGPLRVEVSHLVVPITLQRRLRQRELYEVRRGGAERGVDELARVRREQPPREGHGGREVEGHFSRVVPPGAVEPDLER